MREGWKTRLGSDGNFYMKRGMLGIITGVTIANNRDKIWQAHIPEGNMKVWLQEFDFQIVRHSCE